MKSTAIKSALFIALFATGNAAYSLTAPANGAGQGGITNTRHNMTQSFLGANATIMDGYRNNYGEVCVYCHTPHAANTASNAPLWNRATNTTTYTLYKSNAFGAKTTSAGTTVNNPGPNSLTCLSCHDGTVAIDSIINMPGSGRVDPTGNVTPNNTTFLNTWPSAATNHSGMNVGAVACTLCHANANVDGASQSPGWGPAAFIGTDLSNDHPIGVAYPSAVTNDFTALSSFASKGSGATSVKWIDDGGGTAGTMDHNEIRIYNGQVECASCHDPHGVSSTGVMGGANFPTFLRKSNTGSSLCQTCHTK